MRARPSKRSSRSPTGTSSPPRSPRTLHWKSRSRQRMLAASSVRVRECDRGGNPKSLTCPFRRIPALSAAFLRASGMVIYAPRLLQH